MDNLSTLCLWSHVTFTPVLKSPSRENSWGPDPTPSSLEVRALGTLGGDCRITRLSRGVSLV